MEVRELHRLRRAGEYIVARPDVLDLLYFPDLAMRLEHVRGMETLRIGIPEC